MTGRTARFLPLLLVALVVAAGAGTLWVGGGGAHRPASSQTSPAPATPVWATPAAGPGDVFLVLGDSIAAGAAASSPGTRGYAALVRGYLAAQAGRPVELVNLAVPGATSGEMLGGEGQLARAERAVADAASVGRRVGPVVVTAGANDLLAVPHEPEARERALVETAANLRRLFAGLGAVLAAAGQPGADLVATGYYDLSETDPTLPNTAGWWTARLNATIAAEVGRAGGRMADVAEPFRGRIAELTYAPADIHPNNAGHAEIAAAVWRTLGYDAMSPEVRLDRPAAGPLPRPIPAVAAAVTDRVGVVAVELWVDGASVGPMVYLEDHGLYAAVWDARDAAPGGHTVEVRARDAAGNEGRTAVVVEVGGAGEDADGSPPPSRS